MIGDEAEMSDVDNLVTEAAASMREAVIERLEWELRAAWRAGYDFLHVVSDHGVPPASNPASVSARDITVSRAYIPSNASRLSMPRTSLTVERYDLREVTSAEVDDVIH